jgi:Tol biopolymer transport system component/DNA-binding winged helix-turn-helix (wHTH) protein
LSYRFDDFLIEPAGFRLTKAGAPLRIEPKALEVLIYLVERRDRVVTKQELLDTIWQGTVVTENALTRAVAQIRKVLGDDLQSPKYIQTVPTKGYRFIAASHTDTARSEPAKPAAAAIPVAPEPPAMSRPASPQVPLPATRSRSRSGIPIVVLMAIGAIVLGLLFVNVVGSGLRKKNFAMPAIPPPPITARPLRPAPQLQAFPSFSPDGSMIAYAADVGLTSHIFVSRVDGGEEKQITRGDGETQPAWSPDGNQIAFVSLKRGGIWIISVDGGEPAQLTERGTRPQWSPDGSEIAYQTGESIEYGWTAFDALPASTIAVANVKSGKVRALTAPGQPPGGHGAPSWRRDGNRIAFSSCEIERCGIYTIGRDSSALAEVVTDNRRLSSPVFARESDAVIYVLTRYNDSLLLTVPVDDDGKRSRGNPSRLRQSGPGSIQHVAISRDGLRLAWTLAEESSDLYSVTVGSNATPQQLTRNPTLRSTYPAFSPDGTRIAYSVVAAGVDSGVWTMNADGANAKAVAVGPGLKQHTGWMRDGFSVVYYAWADGPTVFQLSLVSGNAAPIGRLPRDASSPALSPDNSTTAFNRTIGGVTSVWTDMLAGSEPQRVTTVHDLARFPVWSPNGEMLAVQVRNERGSAVGVVPATGGPVRIITTQDGEAHPYSWSPNGKFVSFAGRRNGVWNVYTVPANGGREQRLTNNQSTSTWFRSPAWSAFGNRIVYEQGAPKANVWVSVDR